MTIESQVGESKVAEQYDRLAKIYDRRWSRYVSDTLNLLITYLEESRQIIGNENILDIACGTGELERMLLDLYPDLKIVGVDISEKMLDVSRLKLPNLEFVKASAIALPFPDHKFDLVVTVSAFHYFDNPLDTLKEIRRILKPQGKLIILDWCRDYLFCKALNLFLKIVDPVHKGCYTQIELHNLLISSGFEIINQKKQKLGFFWGIMVATGSPN
jgi:ubiquinone/menaquinone biosynthesis C-methylase UbiE